MTREFDLFERRSDGTLTYRGLVDGIENARVRVRLLANETDHECFAICSDTHEIVARIMPLTPESKRLFQVGYDPHLLELRSELLRRWGYSVTSVIGNDAAKAVLRDRPSYDLFVIGHTAPEDVRLSMVHWLHKHYPNINILALNPPETQQLGDLEYNALYSAPDIWLPLVAAGASAPRGQRPPSARHRNHRGSPRAR